MHHFYSLIFANSKVIEACVRCLFSLCTLEKNYSPMESLYSSLLALLPNTSNPPVARLNKFGLIRALLALGSIEISPPSYSF